MSDDAVSDARNITETLGALVSSSAVARRRLVVQEFGPGWVEMGFFPNDRYRFQEREDGWAVLTFDEQQAGWDKDHGLIATCPNCGGLGEIAEHDPGCRGFNCATQCPVQVQCSWCRGTGRVTEPASDDEGGPDEPF